MRSFVFVILGSVSTLVAPALFGASEPSVNQAAPSGTGLPAAVANPASSTASPTQATIPAPVRPTTPSSGGPSPPVVQPRVTSPPAPSPVIPPPRPPGTTPSSTQPAGSPSLPTFSTPNESARAELDDFYTNELSASPLSAQPGNFGSLSGTSQGGFPQMIGDLGPQSVRVISRATGQSHFPSPFPPPTPPSIRTPRRAAAVIPSVRSIKISEDQSPVPQDRVYFTFNYFQGVNDQVNQRIQSPIGYSQVFRYIAGFEKTFNDGQGSLGLRLPMDTVTTSAASGHSSPGLSATNTSLGDLSLYAKYILWQDRPSGNLLSSGLAVTAPTGPGKFAGDQSFGPTPHSTTLQPFLGYLVNVNRWYIQGFGIVQVPTTSQDVTMLYNDIGIGYFIRRPDPNLNVDEFISLIAPTFEVHVNTPLNHRDVFNVRDPVGTTDIVNFTYGLNLGIYRRTLLTFAMVCPVSSPKPFDLESMVFLNVFFGGTARRVPITPPVVGG